MHRPDVRRLYTTPSEIRANIGKTQPTVENLVLSKNAMTKTVFGDIRSSILDGCKYCTIKIGMSYQIPTSPALCLTI